MSKLKSLELSCSVNTDEIIRYIVHRFNELTSLTVCNLSLEPYWIEITPKGLTEISYMRNLRALRIAYDSMDIDEALIAINQGCHNLGQLHLRSKLKKLSV